jgi:hypothetical protein
MNLEVGREQPPPTMPVSAHLHLLSFVHPPHLCSMRNDRPPPLVMVLTLYLQVTSIGHSWHARSFTESFLLAQSPNDT